MEFDHARRALEAMEREGVRYAVFGGVALAVHGLTRATQDLDLFVAPDRENVDKLKKALLSLYADPSIEEISADDLLGDYPAVRYIPPEGDFFIDILTRLGEAFRWEDLEIQRATFEGLPVSVVTPAMLLRMKSDTVRPQDRIDAESLRRRFDLGDS